MNKFIIVIVDKDSDTLKLVNSILFWMHYGTEFYDLEPNSYYAYELNNYKIVGINNYYNGTLISDVQIKDTLNRFFDGSDEQRIYYFEVVNTNISFIEILQNFNLI